MSIKGQLVLVNYAHNGYWKSQKACSESALTHGEVDRVISLGFDDLSSEFRVRNRNILSAERGAGWWCWKPQVVLQALEQIEPEDILIYADSGWMFKGSARCLYPHLQNNQFVFSEALKRIEGMKSGRRTVLTDCKRYCLDYYGIGPDSQVVDQHLISGGLIMMQNSEFVKSFMKKWRDDMIHNVLMIDDRFDIPKPEHAGFMRHMNDMGPLNILLALTGPFFAITREARHEFMTRQWPREINYKSEPPPRRGF